MSKFCGNCGSQIEDDAKVCGYCGALQDEEPEKATISGLAEKLDEEKVNKIKGIAKKLIPAAVAVVVLVVGIAIASSFIGYKGAIKSFMKAYENQDVDKMVSMFSGVYSENNEYFEDQITDEISSAYDYIDEELGDFKIDYEVVKADKLSEKKTDQFLDRLDEWDYDTDSIKAIRKVKVRLEIEDAEKKTLEFYLLKEDGKWKVYSEYIYGMYEIQIDY